MHLTHEGDDEQRPQDCAEYAEDRGLDGLRRADRRHHQDHSDEERAADHLGVVEYVEGRHRHEDRDQHGVDSGLALRVGNQVGCRTLAHQHGQEQDRHDGADEEDEGHPQQI